MSQKETRGPSNLTWSEEEDRARRENLQLPPGWSVARGNPRIRRVAKPGDFYTHILMPKSILVVEEPVGDRSMRATVLEPGEGRLKKGQSYIFSLNLTVPIFPSAKRIAKQLRKRGRETT